MGVYKGNRGGDFAPRIRFTGEEGDFPIKTWFVGTKLESREIPSMYKDDQGNTKPPTSVFTFSVHDADPKLRIQKKDGKEWKAFDLAEDGKADLMGSGQLEDVKLVPLGTKVRITYNGKVRNPSSGRMYNDFKIEDVEG